MVERQLYPNSSTEDIMNLASTSSSTTTTPTPTTALMNETESPNLRRLRSSTTTKSNNNNDDEKQNLLNVVDDELQQQQKSRKNHSKSNEKSWRTLKSWDKMFVFKPLNLVFIGIVLSIILCLFTYISIFVAPSTKRPTTSPVLTSSIPVPKTIYSGMEPKQGVVWHLNTHEIKRHRQKRFIKNDENEGGEGKRQTRVIGLAKQCGYSCTFRLKSDFINPLSDIINDEKELKVFFERWQQVAKPVSKKNRDIINGQVIPLIQYIDNDEETHARLSKVSPDCLYTASVDGTNEKGIVNLCEKHGGLFGTLALPDGAYLIEPFESTEFRVHQKAYNLPQESDDDDDDKNANFEGNNNVHKRRRKRRSISIDLQPHLIFRAQPRTFDEPIEKPNVNNTSYNNIVEETYENNTEWIDITRRNQRSRRSADSWDHYVEVLVVADNKMLKYHQGNLESYVLTLFSTVASIYRHPTLRASINIIVVRIIILKHERAGPLISNRAQETLQQFCAWQQNYNDRNDDAISHHDVAILLTRHDICRATHKCDTLGLAELGTMCDAQRSCAIIEDNGLSAAFTIAHELGHIFNIPHDDERKCGQYMQLNKHNYHIMAPTLEYNTHPWSWSACSSAMLSKFLDDSRAQTQCILDQPIERKYYDKMFENPAPGAMYDVNQQCRFVFGPAAEICPYMPTCRRLWCSTYYGYQMGCRTQHMPWADGTPCSDNKWCHRGQCVGMAPEQRAKQDGAWGEWKPWGDCTRTCGGGVQKALRDCDNPKPMNGGKYCVGQRERYRPCNIQECPWDTPGFREMQCAEFDNKNVGIHGVPMKTTWVPKYTGISRNERCKLYCRVKDSQAFYLLKEKVLDGTPCDQNGDDICIDGTCHSAGCDHRLGSDMKRDVCGICGGDGSTCQTVEGVYNERGSFGYNEVLKIPAGSANIDIRQNAHNRNKDDDNYLALRASNGEFLLNGQYQVSVFRQQIPIQDVVLEYSGSDHSEEQINGTGPIRSDIYLHVLSVGNLNPPNIHYKYMVPRNNIGPAYRFPTTSNYYWRFSDYFTECSSQCQGSQDRLLHCVDATTNRQANERHCTDRRPPPQKRMCNIDCFIKWKTLDASGCSTRCGHGEKHQQSVCIKSYNNGHEDTINEAECQKANVAKPPSRVPCYTDCTGRKWFYGEWSPCSESCGNNGISRRTIRCVDDANRSIDERHCERISREPLEQECNRIPCPRWVYGHWSECSRSCDGGVRVRHAQCQSAAGQDLSASYCNTSEKDNRQKCNEHTCTAWKFGAWSGCSVSCGTGVETRTAECMDSRGRVLDDGHCGLEKKIVQKQCHRPECPHWEQSSWSQCSVSCQDGWATRLVYCVDSHGKKVRDEICLKINSTRPISHQPCNHGPCPFWRTGEWSKCSSTCGHGQRAREVECIFREQTVDYSLCPESQQPKAREICKLMPCTFWQVEPWSACSTNCGKGIQRRNVKCMRENANKYQVEDHECSQHLKPRSEKPCEREKCKDDVAKEASRVSQIYWATGPWTDCSSPCGAGTQKRQVLCHDHVRQLPDNYCQHIEKEPNERACNVKPCAKWTVGPWLPCPASCGIHHLQQRSVTCTPTEGASSKSIEETDCDIETQPKAVRNCGLPACPKEPEIVLGKWISDEWQECSVSCNGGWRRRTVTCNKKVCNEKEKPTQFERCNEQKCTKAAWQITPWSTCSITCGNQGFQERSIWCQEDINSKQRLEDSECAKHEPKPITRRGCASSPCPIKNQSAPIGPAKTNSVEESLKKYYSWEPGKWSTCSVLCGRGTRNRTVNCINIKTNKTVTDEKCNLLTKPLTEHKCRLALCPRWHKGKWSTCSSICGAGVKKRTIHCKKGRQIIADTECSAFPKPQETEQCESSKCPVYTWKVTPWSKCIDPCKKMNQHRRVYCLNEGGKRAASRMCQNETMPIKIRPCNTDLCPYEWVPGPWSTCSIVCGTVSNSFRRIDCKVKRGMRGQNTKLGSEPTVLSRMCMSLKKPEVNKECAMIPCDAEYRWSVLPWGKCSKTCGPGTRRRKTPCLNRLGVRVPKAKCDKDARPKHRESCFLRNCLPNDCAEIKAQNTITNSIDGNYTVLVAGFRITVYCHLMNNTIPKTFLNVDAETNFGEFYGKRLLYPYTCPYGGKRNDSCACSNDGHVSNGLSRYRRVRVDLQNMKINPHDFTFAQTAYGTPVPYGTAGDCYSASECPQGRFSIDLRGTGLKIVDDLQWMDHGHKSSSKIVRTENNALIRGQCGGFCGECAPDQYKGIIIEIDHKQRPIIGVG